ncbi:putative Zn-dependent hydrolases of the beta-lactamase fold [Candidatus Termititenax persephonae]|uniref:Zn-dependent hydrolases of the beta-lactamase fold n=1 Tax=Candidatus Termititenax persephonae TaxID=2218525 RepID=A0A388TGA3_9BACT|nr:putative Zn-dependent hydrolases of the beta-lactamase fold [Candidatus Termititenax persephonae]
MLEIRYFGHSCFWVRSADGLRVLTDPYSDVLGYVLPRTEADIVLISHNHAMHNCLEAVGGCPAVIQSDGYRELNWVKIRGIPSYHDKERGTRHGGNTIFCWDMQAVRFCHLGDLGCLPDVDLLAQIGPVDVLFFPIGGGRTLTPAEAVELLRLIPYKYAVPMHYRTKYNPRPQFGLAEFMERQKDIIIPCPQNVLSLRRQDCKGAPKVVALTYLPVEGEK